MNRFLITAITLLLTSFSLASQSTEDWNDIRLLEIQVSTYLQKECLQRLEHRLKLAVVSPPEFTLPGEYLVPKSKYKYFIRNLNLCSIKHKLIADNLKEILEEEAEHNDYEKNSRSGRRKRGSDGNSQSAPPKPKPYTHFMNTSETNTWLKTLAVQHKKLVKLHDIGTTFEGREMIIMQVGPDVNDHYVLMESGIHAREWLSPSCNAYLLNKLLLKSSNNDSLILGLLERFTIFFLINANPDGYDFSFEKNRSFKSCRNATYPARFFRKTKQPYGNYEGADPNRNFDAAFYGVDGDRRECSEAYTGPFPFSEKCVKNFATFMNKIKHKNGVPWTVTLSIHCCGKLWILPGSTKEMDVIDEIEKEEQMLVAQAAVNGIIQEGGNIARSYDDTTWKIGTVQQFLGYTATGASHDWYRTRMGARFTYGIELQRSCRGHKFMACPFQIQESGDQIYGALITSLLQIVNLGY